MHNMEISAISGPLVYLCCVVCISHRCCVFEGPTTSNELPAFQWVGEFDQESHEGLPSHYEFEWMSFSAR